MTSIDPLDVLISVRLQIQMGHSLSFSLHNVLEQRMDRFSKTLLLWLKRTEAGQKCDLGQEIFRDLSLTPARRSLVHVLYRGLKGSPVDEGLRDLEKEFFLIAETSYETYLQTLPIRLLFPLSIFILPGVMILLVVPLIESFSGAFQ